MEPRPGAAADGAIDLPRPLFGARERLAPPALHAAPLAGLAAQVLLIAAIAWVSGVGLDATGWVVGIGCAVAANLALARALAYYRADGLSPADRVTLARGTLAVGVAALVAGSFGRHMQVGVLLSLVIPALTLDAVDGWVARRTKTERSLGARLDAEVDSFLILVLSVYVAHSTGVWVLAIGAARYVFLAAGWPLGWMRATLPPREWRKFVAATQGIVLAIAAARVLPLAVDRVALVGALALLAESFGRDVRWLWSHRTASVNLKAPAPTVTKSGRLRTTIATGFTVLAFLLVWAALVAPDHPDWLTLTAFLRVPLELVVLIALAAVLPPTPRRLVAAVVGPALALLVLLKIFDMAFYTYFARPFDILADSSNAGVAVQTLRDAIGATQTDLFIAVGVVVALSLLVFTTLAMFRLMRVAADNRRGSVRAATALGAVWLLCAVSGAHLLSRTPIAATGTAGYFVHEVGAVAADMNDQAVFASQIRHDPFRNTPGSQLLTALRGKDVLLVFVESYGQVSVQGSSFSPAIDSLLRKGTRQLQASGFSARSAFVDAPGFGGASWFAHSTFQSGVWANTQLRYNQLVSTNRFTLSDAFNRAGWRTINFAPADDDHWTDGSSYYHYAKLYDHSSMGYHGPKYSYATMPDQYMFAALQRLELSKPHRRPLFAEVDTVSSHMPWDRVPTMIPWNRLGNGSIFNHAKTLTEPSSFWWHSAQVKAAYARSLEYSLSALISFVQHYGKKNLALIVVGDEQPLAIVSGHGANHEVPISLIAHDPSVLKRITGWGWAAGLLPSPKGPAWGMGSFRNRFLTAFDSPAATK